MLLATMLVEGLMFIIPYFFENGMGMGIIESGLYFAIISVVVVLLSVPIGKYCESHGCRNILTIGSIIAMCFSLVFAMIEKDWSIFLLIIPLIAVGCSYAIFETAHYVRLIRQVPDFLKDEAATFGSMIAFLGASLGVAVFDIALDAAVENGITEGFHICAIISIILAIASAALTLFVKEKDVDGSKN